MSSTVIDQDFPYDILHRGDKDANRHNKRVNDAVRKQLKDIISQQDIITSEGNKKVKVRLKYLDEYRFIHNRDRIERIGRDEFDDLSEGEILDRPQGGDGSPNRAGEDEGEVLFEAEYTVEELTDMMIEELKLPDLDETKKNEIISEVLEWTDRRKQSGIQALLDKKKTLLANMLRKSKMQVNEEENLPIIKDDLRYKTWNISNEKHSNAVIFLIMDRSGSMFEEKIYAVKSLYFWIVQFIKRKYDRVDIKFIAHDTIARELNEKDFFTISDDGGTIISSAYELCLEKIKHNYPQSQWNVYCFHASDGDSFGSDNDKCLKLVKEIMNLGTNLFAYTEINMDDYRDNESDLYKKLQDSKIPGVLVSSISELEDVMAVLKYFLRASSVREIT